jgi:hypothetical protein
VSITAATHDSIRAAGHSTGPAGRVAASIDSLLLEFERNPSAREAFLARFPTRLVRVNRRTAERIAEAKEDLNSKVRGKSRGLSLRLVDDAINRALDKVEGKAAKRSGR